MSANFSMSSMTDIVFLLLIFFMVTSTLVHPNAIKLLIPKKATTETSIKDFVNVRVTKSGSYYVNGSKTSAELFENKLVRTMGSNKKKVVKFTIEKNVSTGLAAHVLDVAENNNIKVILDIK